MMRGCTSPRLVFALIFSTLLFSCEEEETPEVTPSITIVSPSSADLLRKTIVVEAEVVQTGFSRAEIFLDDVLIGESLETVINFSFDTKLVDDGIHTLKIVATGRKNKKVEASTEIEILNNLFIFSVPVNYLDDTRAMWFYITDNNGKILGVHKCVNNETFSFETPDDYTKGQSYILHKFEKRPYLSNGTSGTITSYTGMKPGKFWYLPASTSSAATGNYTLTVNNVPATFNRRSLSGEFITFGSSGSGNILIQATVPIYNVNLLCHFANINDRNVPLKYKYLENVTAGQSATFDFQTFTDMNLVEYTFDSQMDQVMTTLLGYDRSKNAHRFIDQYTQLNTNSAKFYYPGNAFAEYQTQIWRTKGNRTDVYSQVGTIPTSYKTLNASVSSIELIESVLTVNSIGIFDEVRVTSSENWTAPSGLPVAFNWHVYMNDDTKKQIKLAAIPSEILNEFPQFSGAPIDFDEAVLHEADSYTSYQDFIRLTLQLPPGTFYIWKESMTTTILF